MSTLSPPPVPPPTPGTLWPMNDSITLVGVGEMGAVFAHALLRTGHPISPVLRSTPLSTAVERDPNPGLTLVTVAEDDLHPVLESLPPEWRSNVGLIQNELLPRDWIRHGIEAPTVAVVWFEKKPGRTTRVLVPTPVAGPWSCEVVEALTAIDIPAEQIPDDDLIHALVAKNLYILTANIGGLRTQGTVTDLWNGHRDFAATIASEILDIQDWLVGEPVDRDRAVEGMVAAIDGDPGHGTTGRSAPRRLERAIVHARTAGIETPMLIAIGREAGLSV